MGLRLAARWLARGITTYLVFWSLLSKKNLVVHKVFPQTGAQVWRNVIIVLWSPQNRLHHLAGDIGQTVVPSRVAVGQPLVVQS